MMQSSKLRITTYQVKLFQDWPTGMLRIPTKEMVNDVVAKDLSFALALFQRTDQWNFCQDMGEQIILI